MMATSKKDQKMQNDLNRRLSCEPKIKYIRVDKKTKKKVC